MSSDKRALYAAGIAAIAIISATILGVAGQVELAIAEGGLASSALMFVIGLHSEPQTEPNNDPMGVAD